MACLIYDIVVKALHYANAFKARGRGQLDKDEFGLGGTNGRVGEPQRRWKDEHRTAFKSAHHCGA